MVEDSIIRNLCAGLVEQDWAVCERFLDPERVAVLRLEAQSLFDAGRFSAAGVGQEATQHADIRSDRSLWLIPDTTPLAWMLLQQELEALRLAVNAASFLGLHEFEGHYAAYPPGAFYARHLDRFREGNQRVVSVVLYLNDDWRVGDGGELRLYPEGPRASGPITLSPQGGTLVCFLSEGMPHEVLASQRLRLSLTGWFRRRG